VAEGLGLTPHFKEVLFGAPTVERLRIYLFWSRRGDQQLVSRPLRPRKHLWNLGFIHRIGCKVVTRVKLDNSNMKSDAMWSKLCFPCWSILNSEPGSHWMVGNTCSASRGVVYGVASLVSMDISNLQAKLILKQFLSQVPFRRLG